MTIIRDLPAAGIRLKGGDSLVEIGDVP